MLKDVLGKTGQPDGQAPSGSVSGADVSRQRATRLPPHGAPPQYEASAVRHAGPDGVDPSHPYALGAVSTLWIPEELPPVAGGTVGCQSRDRTARPPARGTTS